MYGGTSCYNEFDLEYKLSLAGVINNNSLSSVVVVVNKRSSAIFYFGA